MDGLGGYYCRDCFPIQQDVQQVKCGSDCWPVREVSIAEALRIRRKELSLGGVAPYFVDALPSATAHNLLPVCSVLFTRRWTGDERIETAVRLALQTAFSCNGQDLDKVLQPPGYAEASIACAIQDAIDYQRLVTQRLQMAKEYKLSCA
jgi:hypothetical protein